MLLTEVTPSPPRPILSNTTNTDIPDTLGLRSPPKDGKRRPAGNWLLGPRKRVKTQHVDGAHDSSSDESDSEVDVEKVVVSRARRYNAFGIRDAWMSAGPSSRARLPQRALSFHIKYRKRTQLIFHCCLLEQCPHDQSCSHSSPITNAMCSNAIRYMTTRI